VSEVVILLAFGAELAHRASGLLNAFDPIPIDLYKTARLACLAYIRPDARQISVKVPDPQISDPHMDDARSCWEQQGADREIGVLGNDGELVVSGVSPDFAVAPIRTDIMDELAIAAGPEREPSGQIGVDQVAGHQAVSCTL
jgi:hypothetical protein